jgi:hypothetical protein
VVRVLVVGTDQGSMATAEVLRDGGHDVTRCHEPDQPSFPCAGLTTGEVCPLESAPVDVCVAVREGHDRSDELHAHEMGAQCALRRNVPLVLVGHHGDAPLVPWSTSVALEPATVLDAVAAAATQTLRRHEDVASDVFREVLDTHDLSTTEFSVRVSREGTALHVDLRPLAAIPDDVGEMACVRVAGAIRGIDAHASTIGVGLTPGARAPEAQD